MFEENKIRLCEYLVPKKVISRIVAFSLPSSSGFP